jgi:phosphohistidine phosphatase
MDIYLVRHAAAVARGTTGTDTDEERPLSEEGWKQAASLGRVFKKRGIIPEMVVTSPLVRAVQTATELCTVLELGDGHMETRYELAPDGRPRKLAKYLNGLPWQSVIMVGHQPDLGRCAGWLLGNKEMQIDFAKGGAAMIRVEGALAKGAGTLMWLISPMWIE